jgi:heme/copper-type cytochrome/quinol oxidase subunit 2
MFAKVFYDHDYSLTTVYLLCALAQSVLPVIALLPCAFLASKALRRCQAHQREMEPFQVWLNVVPVVNILWLFLTVYCVTSALSDVQPR